MHSRCVHPFIHSFSQSVIHSFIQSFIPSFIHLFSHSFIHSFSQSVSQLFIHSFIHTLSHSLQPPIPLYSPQVRTYPVDDPFPHPNLRKQLPLQLLCPRRPLAHTPAPSGGQISPVPTAQAMAPSSYARPRVLQLHGLSLLPQPHAAQVQLGAVEAMVLACEQA